MENFYPLSSLSKKITDVEKQHSKKNWETRHKTSYNFSTLFQSRRQTHPKNLCSCFSVGWIIPEFMSHSWGMLVLRICWFFTVWNFSQLSAAKCFLSSLLKLVETSILVNFAMTTDPPISQSCTQVNHKAPYQSWLTEISDLFGFFFFFA